MKTFRTPLLFSAALLATTLLPSCQWNIGECIRAGSAVHLGGDTRHPVGGKVYRDPADKRDEWSYAYVPELSYRMKPESVEYWFLTWPHRKAYEVKPTGRTILVRYSPLGYEGVVEKVDALPEGAVLRAKGESMAYQLDRELKLVFGDLPGKGATRGSLGEGAVLRAKGESMAYQLDRELELVFGDLPGKGATRGSLGDQLMAAPFDYLIDPALTVVTTPLFVAGMTLCISTGLLELYKDCSWFRQEQKEDFPQTEPIDAES